MPKYQYHIRKLIRPRRIKIVRKWISNNNEELLMHKILLCITTFWQIEFCCGLNWKEISLWIFCSRWMHIGFFWWSSSSGSLPSHFLSQKDMKKWREMVFQGQKIKATGKLKKLIGHQLFFKQQVNFGCWHHQLPSINWGKNQMSITLWCY